MRCYPRWKRAGEWPGLVAAAVGMVATRSQCLAPLVVLVLCRPCLLPLVQLELE